MKQRLRRIRFMLLPSSKPSQPPLPLGRLLLGILWLLFVDRASCSSSSANKKYVFALVPKTTDNPFFLAARDGCEDQCEILNNCTCLYGGIEATLDNPNPDPYGALQADYVQQLLLNSTQQQIDGLAISVKNATLIEPILDESSNIPIITFDSDLSSPKNRRAYVGTDNIFMGQTLAKVVQQIIPDGGMYGIINPDDSPNVQERDRGFRDKMMSDDDEDEQLWTELPGSPVVYDRDLDKALQILKEFAANTAQSHIHTVLVATVGGPLFHENYADFYREHVRNRNITIVTADDFSVQIEHLSHGYVHGLVGQMPYEMGKIAIQVLMDLVLQDDDGTSSSSSMVVPDKIGTNLITHIQVPLVLPELHVNNNLIGRKFRIIGYVLFGLILFTSCVCGIWTFVRRHLTVVQAAQPIFLILLAVGVVILGSTIIPLSMDDNGGYESAANEENEESIRAKAICMSIPWLASCGLTITFSALFSKTIRINRIVEETRGCHRVKITACDVLVPFSVIITFNVIILVLWSVLDPLMYVRKDKPGTDGWNRTIATYGACRCDNPEAFLIPLAVINLGLLLMANWQAYKSRKIRTEFAESKYIAICMLSLLEALLIGMPILLVVRNSPQAFYLTIVFMLFVICMGILLLLFVPKMNIANEYSHRSIAEQQRMLMASIRESAVVSNPPGSSSSKSLRLAGGSPTGSPASSFKKVVEANDEAILVVDNSSPAETKTEQ